MNIPEEVISYFVSAKPIAVKEDPDWPYPPLEVSPGIDLVLRGSKQSVTVFAEKVDLKRYTTFEFMLCKDGYPVFIPNMVEARLGETANLSIPQVAEMFRILKASHKLTFEKRPGYEQVPVLREKYKDKSGQARIAPASLKKPNLYTATASTTNMRWTIR